MGSIGMFDSVLCVACKEWTVPRTYSGVEYCDRCGVKSRRKFIIDKIDFGVELGEEFRNRFAAFLGSGVYWKQQQRLHYVHCVLLSRHSAFGKFTYFSNGLAGSISETETILDRVLSFLGTASASSQQSSAFQES